MAKVAVIISVKNEREYIERVLKNLYEQTVKPKRIVVIDDGSTDDTNKYLKKFARNKSRTLKIIERPERKNGPSLTGTPEMATNFNLGFRMIREMEIDFDFIMVCGADDLYPVDYIERLLKKFYENTNLVIASGVARNQLFSRSANSPQGGGRLIRNGLFWKDWGEEYAYPSYYWESKCLYQAQFWNYDTKVFKDIIFDTRAPGKMTDQRKNGIAHRAILYPFPHVFRKMLGHFIKFQWKMLYQYFVGYVRKPKIIIINDREFSKEVVRKLIWRRF